MTSDVLLNIAWMVAMSLLGLALPVGVGMMAGRERPGSGRLLLAGLLALLVSWACGFSLQYGAIHIPQLGEVPRAAWQWLPFGEGSGLLGWGGPGLPVEAGRPALFLFQAVGAATVVVLALAPLEHRIPGPALVGMAVLIGGVLYPLLGHWVWGGGWLASVGRTAYMGHGFVDYGGAGAHYALGGLLALAGLLARRAEERLPEETDELALPALRLRSRRQRYVEARQVAEAVLRQRGKAPDSADPGPYLGGILALLGLTALNLAAAWEVVPRLALVAANTWLGAAAGGLTAAVYMAFTTTRFHPVMLARGLVAGAVAGAGLAPFASPVALLVVGAGAGLIACLGSYLLTQVWHLPDASGIVPAFGLAGLWGVLAVGLFADGTFGRGLNGVGAGLYLGVVGQGVSGILLLSPGMRPDFGQLTAQLLGLVVIAGWALGPGWLFFRLGAGRLPERSR
ncbi:MAG: hypothetical protein ACP5OO_11990 [Chloroflexia bacterium]